MCDISMIILAGGKSSRMGMDKSDLLLGDKSFLSIQIEKAEKLGIGDVVISGYRGRQQLAYPTLPDARADQGPLGGLSTCLGAVQNAWALVLSVDAPLVPAEELERLILFARNCERRAVIVQAGEQQYPLIGVYHTGLAGAMQEEIALHRGSVFALLRRVGYDIYKTDADPSLFANVNDPESYQKLLNP